MMDVTQAQLELEFDSSTVKEPNQATEPPKADSLNKAGVSSALVYSFPDRQARRQQATEEALLAQIAARVKYF